MFRYRTTINFLLSLFCSAVLQQRIVQAQTEIQIVAPEKGYRFAAPVFCDLGRAAPYTQQLPQLIRENLDKSPLFAMLDTALYSEAPGVCVGNAAGELGSWRAISTELLIRGNARVIGVDVPTLEVELYLFDVSNGQTLIGLQYSAPIREAKSIADRFSNAVLEYFSGRKSVYGSKVAYIERVGPAKELFVMDFNGDNVSQLTNDRSIALSPEWSPDGSELLYLSFKAKRANLYRYTFANKLNKRVTDWATAPIGAVYGSDGRSILAGARISGLLQIVEFNQRGGFVRSITSDDGINISPSLSPDKNSIAYVSTHETGIDAGPQIYVRSLSGGSAERISFTKSNYCTSPAWSPEGSMIAFVCEKNGSQIFIVDPNGGAAVQLTFSGNNESPSWSPDGKSLIYSSNFGGSSQTNIAVFSLTEFNSWRLTESANEQTQPAWSPIAQ